MHIVKKLNAQVGFGTCVEFATEDGHYVATWSKETSQLTLTMPGGATLYSIGNNVIYDPFSNSINQDDTEQTKNSTEKKDFTHTQDLIQKKKLVQPEDTTQKEDSAQIENLNDKIETIPFLNTRGAYIFDVVKVNLCRFE